MAMNIERLRDDKGLRQEDLADMTGLAQSTISKIEKGGDGVTLRSLKKIAIALGVEVSDLLVSDRSTKEQQLIAAYRLLPPERRAGWDDIVLGVLSQRPQSDREQS